VKVSKRMQRALEKLERVPGGLVLAEDMLADWAERAEGGAKAYEKFHWGDEASELEATQVATLRSGELVVALGELVEVVYETSKDGKVYDWVHAFEGERPMLAHVTDDRGNSRAPSLVITGGSYKVSTRGIVG